MKSKQIFFTGVHKAELLEVDVRELAENEVLTEMEYTVVSGGTERHALWECIIHLKGFLCPWAIVVWDA